MPTLDPLAGLDPANLTTAERLQYAEILAIRAQAASTEAQATAMRESAVQQLEVAAANKALAAAQHAAATAYRAQGDALGSVYGSVLTLLARVAWSSIDTPAEQERVLDRLIDLDARLRAKLGIRG